MERIGIVGASTLLGKELAEALGDSVLAGSTVVLLDDDKFAGVLATAGDEAAVVQSIVATSFDGMDFVFFAGTAASTRAHWQAARAAGASVIDLTYSLEGEPGILVRGPWSPGAGASAPDLRTTAVVVAHPAAAMLALVGSRLGAALPVVSLSATVLEPASERGRAAMDELQEQTVNLLSFKTVPQEQHDLQVAFNLLPRLGAEAKVAWADTRQRIMAHARVLAPSLPETVVQLVHAPVFHGLTLSAMVEVAEPATVLQVERALSGSPLDLVSEGSAPPSNLTAAGQSDVLVQVQPAFAEQAGRRLWVWLAADNLRLSALGAIACALELRRVRPRGTVQ